MSFYWCVRQASNRDSMSILQAAVRRLTVNLDDRVSGDLDTEKQLSIDRKSRTSVDLGELPRAFTARQQELSTLTQRLVSLLAFIAVLIQAMCNGRRAASTREPVDYGVVPEPSF